MPRGKRPLGPGDKAPDFTLPEAASGEAVGLSDLAGKPLMLYFGRGTW